MRGVRLHRRIVVVAAVFVLAIAGGAWAFQQLPPGGQVNSDPEAGINPAPTFCAKIVWPVGSFPALVTRLLKKVMS